ncbi:iron(III) transport system ATP-binding protein/putative spermidine/putrescine transport system ATP-binding protein [Actinopolymorpha cephalotaxi]|uniref:ABC-type quaternary amine transporter n=1 Tax=Actinopolymorpha cephalotaxi TaxID=504797 RepID=A0A1I2KXV7_9ACTN|nr:ABC transporter ATP-binding protein [Actinopolymorpha cephalotaxi]NYH84711.1 ABC-type Fe3+/spermidine/putrescine transport system ATPase subunit [Actinopolymorpha cephalotaxi]SFF71139.1 iron(III) transport system ATP-binding protein/putative spermidine/putrescine transport system ATP-binding protein [Actinopolymorpha cephalotaxi]
MAEPTSAVSDRQGPDDPANAATGAAGATGTAASAGGADRDADAGLVLHQVAKTLGGRLIVDNLDLRVRRGELVCLLGPSGCGKTTTLRMIGGFLRPDAGQVLIGGRGYTTTPPERRPTAMVFQNYALWPHMNVFRNVAFGLRLRKLPKAEIAERVERTLALVNLTHHIRSFPAQISGGEQQRVALARALVLEPEVLLLDEPLSNLDAKLRVKVREDIKEIQQRVGITTVFVTHDQDEALSISDRIAVMNAGRIEQYAGAHDLYREPRTRFVADFVGTMNFFEARVREAPAGGAGGIGRVAGPGAVVEVGDVAVPCQAPSALTEQPGLVGVRPEDVRVGQPGGVPARVVREVPRGHFTEFVLELGPLTLRAFVGADTPVGQETVPVTFGRALVYADGKLRSERPVGRADG